VWCRWRRRAGKKKEEAANAACAELETFFHLLVVVRLLDDKRHEEASKSATELVAKVRSFVRPTLTPVAAKAFFYLSRAAELLGGEHYAAVRPILLNAHITAGLQHANEAQVEWGKLRSVVLSMTDFVFFTADDFESLAPQLFASFSVCSGRQAVVQIEPCDDHVERWKCQQQPDCSISSLSGANQGGAACVRHSFRVLGGITSQSSARNGAWVSSCHVRKKKKKRKILIFFFFSCPHSHKFLIIVQLLMGEIPERSLFAQTELAGALRPYFLLARAVRLGDLESYNKAVSTYSASFARDDTVIGLSFWFGGYSQSIRNSACVGCSSSSQCDQNRTAKNQFGVRDLSFVAVFVFFLKNKKVMLAFRSRTFAKAAFGVSQGCRVCGGKSDSRRSCGGDD
jgi:26S proteasome regulatory subunit N3